LNKPGSTPNYITTGNKILQSKDRETVNPAKYRAVVCLSSTYMFINPILANTIYKHDERNKIQTGKHKGAENFF
jgi:hypothetical protein